MTRVATPANEAILLNIARYGTASHVERTVRQFRRLERIETAQLAAEGLGLMAGQFLADADKASAASGDRYQVVVRVDQRLLSDRPTTAGAVAPDETDTPVAAGADRGLCELESGTALADHIPVDECFRGSISARNRANGIRIGPHTVDTRWGGERMDYSIAIDALMAAREREKAPPDRVHPAA